MSNLPAIIGLLILGNSGPEPTNRGMLLLTAISSLCMPAAFMVGFLSYMLFGLWHYDAVHGAIFINCMLYGICFWIMTWFLHIFTGGNGGGIPGLIICCFLIAKIILGTDGLCDQADAAPTACIIVEKEIPQAAYDWYLNSSADDAENLWMSSSKWYTLLYHYKSSWNKLEKVKGYKDATLRSWTTGHYTEGEVQWLQFEQWCAKHNASDYLPNDLKPTFIPNAPDKYEFKRSSDQWGGNMVERR